MEDKVVVVGAGSIGILSAAKFLDYGFRVDMFEASSVGGGVTRDFSNSSSEMYFKGCQYLLKEQIPENLISTQKLIEFEHTYASLTQQNGAWNYKFDFAGPAFHLSELPSYQPPTESLTVEDRLLLYPPDISAFLERHISKICSTSLNELHVTSLTSLGLNRIASMNNDQELLAKKTENATIDLLYGVPRKILEIPREKAFLPAKGFNDLWDSLLKDLISQKRFSYSSNIQINSKNFSDLLPKNLSASKIWCADPRYLVRQIQQINLESVRSIVHNYGLTLNKYVGPELPFYVNIYSPTCPFIRIFIYELNSEVKMSIETSSLFNSQESLVTSLKTLLNFAQISVEIMNPDSAYKKSVRYFPISTFDYDTLWRISRDLKIDDWLDSGLYSYDRLTRLKIIFSQIN